MKFTNNAVFHQSCDPFFYQTHMVYKFYMVNKAKKGEGGEKKLGRREMKILVGTGCSLMCVLQKITVNSPISLQSM